MKRVAGFLFFMLLATSTGVWGDEVKFIDKNNLADLLDSPDIVILDVRIGKDWNAGEYKIKHAVHLTGDMVDSFMSKVPKDKIIVLYCA